MSRRRKLGPRRLYTGFEALHLSSEGSDMGE